MRDPDFTGRARVWRCDERTPASESTVAAYLVHFPGAHAFWQWWTVAIVHLRPMPGAPPPKLQRPTASHEVLFIARDIGTDGGTPLKQVDPDRASTWGKILMPLDLAHQIDECTDEMARTLGSLIAEHIARGGMPPDSDYRNLWAELIDGTAGHLRAGRHLPG